MNDPSQLMRQRTITVVLLIGLAFGVVTLVLGVVSLLGLYLPARRAARVDPVQLLRNE